MRRILIIDDEDHIRDVAAFSLEAMAGWRVDTASSGPDGIRTATFYPPDAILLDVIMPAMDGPSTFRQLQKTPALAAIPVILLTAEATNANERRFNELGVVGVLAKPFDPLTLADQISSTLGWN